jgi:hypothetical protein
MPPAAISGELVLPGQQSTSVGKLRSEKNVNLWKEAVMYAFDMPGRPMRDKPFHERLRTLRELVNDACKGHRACPLRYVEHHTMRDPKLFLRTFDHITSCTGAYKKDPCLGEGVVVTDPASRYIAGKRSRVTRFKLKRRQDAEGTVVGHTDKSLRVRVEAQPGIPKSVTFLLGNGFSHEQRLHLRRQFPEGTIVKFEFRSVGKHGAPKEASFIGERFKEDMTGQRV